MLKKNIAAVLILAGALVLPYASFAQAQQTPPATAPNTVSDQDIQLLREDVRSEKKQLIAANLQLTDAEATKFWPVYDAYAAEATKIGDTRLALIKEYAQDLRHHDRCAGQEPDQEMGGHRRGHRESAHAVHTEVRGRIARQEGGALLPARPAYRLGD